MSSTIFIRSVCIAFSLLLWTDVDAQGFECDGSFFVIMYAESEGQSKLYQITKGDDQFNFDPIPLSEPRKLFGLSYNTRDLHLWAMDADEFELVRIDFNGRMEVMARVENLDPELSYSSGMISPDGNSYYFIGYHSSEDRAQKFYEIEINEPEYMTVIDDISASGSSRILDMAVDPIFGAVYGYNNVNGTIVQFGIDGQIATISQSRREEQFIEGLFFDRDAVLYGYTAKGELYQVDKVEGNLQFLQRGPQGTMVDGCACPYTYSFQKDISERVIIPCEPFEVTYSFTNHLGISHTGIQLRDTFPDGFKILNVTSSVAYTPGYDQEWANILALNNMIYLMGNNTVRVEVRPPDSFFGKFSSQARQQPFPAAFSTIHFSDDPMTDPSPDETEAEVALNLSDRLEDFLRFSCDGQTAVITAPAKAQNYLWSNGSMASQIEVGSTGTYELKIENECFLYIDSVVIEEFPPPKKVDLGDDRIVELGDSVWIEATVNRGDIGDINWRLNGSPYDCTECHRLILYPDLDLLVTVEVTDSSGCMASDEVFVVVEFEQSLYAPNAFSPNGDGVNDIFYISSAAPGTMSLFIYNRWGNLVHESHQSPLSNESGGWNGHMDGELLSSGPYLWVAEIDYHNGQKETRTGGFVLISR